MSALCPDCACVAPARSGVGSRLLLSTGQRHTEALLCAAVGGAGAGCRALAPGLLEVTGDDLDGVVRAAAGELSSVEAGEVRCLRTGDRVGAALLAAAMTAPSLRTADARLRYADLLPLLDAELSHFHCEYQPIVELASRRTTGHEALLRATDRAGRRLLPEDLFPAAEAAGWTEVLDRIGRTTALRDAGPWLGAQTLFINFVPTSIYRAEICLQSTQAAARAAGLRPDQLVFEVTEGHRVRDVEHLARVFAHHRSLGCRVALDDLGAGWASLNLLVGLRPDVVKIDREIVQALPGDAASAVVRAVVAIAHSYGGQVLVEGVETEEQAAAALSLRADLGQGFLFGRPVDVLGGRDRPGSQV